ALLSFPVSFLPASPLPSSPRLPSYLPRLRFNPHTRLNRSRLSSITLRVKLTVAILVLSALTFALPLRSATLQCKDQRSGTTARFRGVCAVNSKVAWASGTGGTWSLTTDGGNTWKSSVVPGAEALDFRDIEAFSSDVAYVMSIGAGDSSRIYKTTDSG